MMSPPPSQELTKRAAGQLMPPPPPPKRIKRPATVLDEDIYTNTLSHIIARDFFPGLLETQTKQEYLDALESKDKAWITSSKKKLADVMRTPTPGSNTRRKTNPSTPQFERPGDTPHATPRGWGGETPMTPMSVVSDSTAVETPKVPDVSNMGLLAFQSKYTSDDSESFNKVVDKQNEKKREKYPWLWNNNKIPSARQIAHSQQETKRIAAAGRNTETSLVPIKTDLDARPAKPDSWKHRPDNNLMFLPSSVEDTHETRNQKAETTSRAGPKRTLYQNTRLLDTKAAAAADAIPPSPSLSAIQDAIAGQPRLNESEVYTGSETPRVNGYAFVDEDEPDPEPSTDETDWGLLGSSSTEHNPFQLAATGKREALHHRMVDRVARNKRAEKAANNKTPLPLATPGRSFARNTPNMLTPAAQRLLRTVGTPREKRGVDWTPTRRK